MRLFHVSKNFTALRNSGELTYIKQFGRGATTPEDRQEASPEGRDGIDEDNPPDPPKGLGHSENLSIQEQECEFDRKKNDPE